MLNLYTSHRFGLVRSRRLCSTETKDHEKTFTGFLGFDSEVCDQNLSLGLSRRDERCGIASLVDRQRIWDPHYSTI
jgi:hypothetical protein